MFYGECLPDGTFIQHGVLDPSDRKYGKWWFGDSKLWLELTGQWTKYTSPGNGPSTLYLMGHGEFGTISRIDEANRYYPVPKATSEYRIPKIIHACWFSGSTLGDLQKKCIASWKKHLPGYEIRIWDSATWSPDKFLFSQEAFENRQWAFVSDVHRLDALHDHGGIYLDLDVEVKKPFDPFLSHEFFTGTEPTNGACFAITPYIIGSGRNNKLIEELLGHYNDRHFVNPDGTFDRRTNTTIIHETMVRHGASNVDNMVEEFIPGHFRYPSWVLACDSHLSYAVHHFEGAWLRQPRALPPSDSDRAIVRKNAFNRIYSQSLCCGGGSGPGSRPDFTEGYREFLENYVRRHNVKSILDIGCGDWEFSRLVDWSGARYHGVDIVAALIETNNRIYGKDQVSFEVLDAVESELPNADLVILKDVLQHLSTESVSRVIGRLGGFDRVLIAQDHGPANPDCLDGDYRPMDLSAAPFDLPVRRIFEFEKWNKIVHEWRPCRPITDKRPELIELLA